MDFRAYFGHFSLFTLYDIICHYYVANITFDSNIYYVKTQNRNRGKHWSATLLSLSSSSIISDDNDKDDDNNDDCVIMNMKRR